jgi:hypothetical protein
MDKKTSLPSSMRSRLGDLVAQAEKEALKGTTIRDLTRIPVKRKQAKPRPTRPKTHAESFKDLDAWHEEAVAGMPDESLARAANVSMTAVLEWRKVRKIVRKKGWERRRETEVWAIDAFGDGYVSEIQAAQSRVKGQWDLPEYVLRRALDYDEMSRALFFLHHEQGTGIDTLAKAFGLRERDVEMAIAVETAHLHEHGAPCVVCGRVCDPAYGDTCSTRCRAEKK